MIKFLRARNISSNVRPGCACACYNPQCQTDTSYMLGYAEGLADVILGSATLS